MAASSTVVLALAVLAAVLLAGGSGAQADCQGDLLALATQCLPFVKVGGPNIPPSAGCCDAVKAADIPCVCSKVTPDLQKMISMEKVVFVAKTCGRPVVPGTKCGSYTVPPRFF